MKNINFFRFVCIHILFAISLISNNDDLIYIGLEGIVLFFNIPILISSSRYKKKIKKDIIVNNLEISNINNLIKDNKIIIEQLNNKITKDNEEKIKETNNNIYINNSNQELIKILRRM